MNFGYDWMVIGTIGERVVLDGSKDYFHEKIDQCDGWKIVQIGIDGWTKDLARIGWSWKDGWTNRGFACNLVEFEVQLIHRIGGDNLEG